MSNDAVRRLKELDSLDPERPFAGLEMSHKRVPNEVSAPTMTSPQGTRAAAEVAAFTSLCLFRGIRGERLITKKPHTFHLWDWTIGSSVARQPSPAIVDAVRVNWPVGVSFMTSLTISLIVFGVILGGAIVGLLLRA